MQTIIKRISKAGVTVLLLALTLLTTGCGGGLLASKTSSASPSASATASAPAAPTFTTDQQLASTACLNADEQKALQPGSDDLDKKLLETCRTVGQKTFDSLSDANKNQKMVADIATELRTTDSLNRAAFIVSSLKNVKEVEVAGIPITDTQAFASQFKSFLPNATQDDINAGSAAVDKAKHTVETGGAPFYHGNNITYLDSTTTIAAWLASGSPESNAAKDRVIAAVKAVGGDDTEVARAMTGAGYFPVQFKGASQVMGTTYFQDGVKPVDQWRQSQPGDIYWLYITSKGVLVPDATLRADCGNVSAKQIRVVKPGIPPAVSVSQPPGQETCTGNLELQPNGECTTPPPVAPLGGCQSGCAPPPPGCQENCTPPSLEAKNIEEAPQRQNNVPQQQYPNQLPAAPEQKQPEQPANPAPVYTPPAQTTQTQAPHVDSQTPTSPQPTVAPSTQPPNNGNIDPAPSSGAPCNSDFQSCP